MPQFIVAANWKMNKDPQDVAPYLAELSNLLGKQHADLILFFPPALIAFEFSKSLSARKGFLWGGQNCHFEKAGAFTGENSLHTLKKMGATWVLVGHSERRSLFGESDDLISKKVRSAQDLDLIPMLCVGESLKERDGNQTNAVIERQLRDGLKRADTGKTIAIAYEPVWAIGTGRVASPNQVSEAHSFLRQVLKKFWNSADEVSLLYGGSVNAQNAVELAQIPQVDGFLVGGASLKPESFAPIASVSKKSIGQP